MKTARAATRSTGLFSRIVPGGNEAAISSGNRPMPSEGTDGEPSTNDRINRRAKLAEVDPSRSASTPARNGSITPERSGPVIPYASRSAARVRSGRFKVARTGRSEPAAQSANRSFSIVEPRGARSVPGNRPGDRRGSARVQRSAPRATTTPASNRRRSNAAGSTTSDRAG